ncbi:MAG: hypothetical protein SPJ13_01350 [Bacteroidales bacterium]|nr:hypothetical protein [Bacteroidales bacterium]
MAEVILNKEGNEISSANDSIVIINALSHIPGGRSLNVSGVASGTTVIKAGHIIIQNDTTKECSPLGVSAGAYVSLPDGHSYLGVLKVTIPVKDARASIVTAGQINAAASPYPVTTAIKNGLPRIEFLY